MWYVSQQLNSVVKPVLLTDFVQQHHFAAVATDDKMNVRKLGTHSRHHAHEQVDAFAVHHPRHHHDVDALVCIGIGIGIGIGIDIGIDIDIGIGIGMGIGSGIWISISISICIA